MRGKAKRVPAIRAESGSKKVLSPKFLAHTFKPGQSGNPSGRPAMTPFSDAIRKLLSEGNGYDAVVQAMLNQALTGDVRAAQYLTDRLEGRPIQSVLVSKPEDSQPIEERLRVALDYARARKAELEK